MKNITLEEMLNMEVQDLLNGYPSGGLTYYYKDGNGRYSEIVELDLLRGRFVTDNGDFSEFSWELKESHIYIDIEEPKDENNCSGCVYEDADGSTTAISNCVCCSRNVEYAKNDYYRKK